MNEFELINTYFMHSDANGDDAAAITVHPGNQLLTSIDTLIAGRHFLETADPFDIGFKSLAVSISDIAAMGAMPCSFLLSLSLPNLDEKWLSAFSQGLYHIADQFGMQHIGGDMTKGPPAISCVAFGQAPTNKALKRSGAHVDDGIYLSGKIGDAGCALRNKSYDQTRLNRPQPRVELGMALRDIATSCIDVSDGLTQDLQHILTASHVGALLCADTIPHSGMLQQALCAGDDYELCFTAPNKCDTQLQAIAAKLDIPITRIGHITTDRNLLIIDKKNNALDLTLDGYKHF